MIYARLAVVAVLLACASAAVFDLSDEVAIQGHFNSFVRRFNKNYGQEEAAHRYAVFKQTLERVNKLQRLAGKATEFGVTKFSDLTLEEFRTLYLSKPKSAQDLVGRAAGTAKPTGKLGDLPQSFDWRDKNMVTPVKNQGQCGSCWAFSATEAIESQWLISGHSQALLAPQQIVDCDTTSYGCEGGWPSHAFEYIIGAGGQELESEYPYQAVTGSCSFDKTKVAATISSYMNVSADENQMAQVLYEKGPLSVALDAQVLQSYVSGIVQAFLCGKQLDHAVLITGFSVDNNLGVFKENVWHVRNSWGADWGEQGYFRLQRGHNACGITEAVTIPSV